MKQTDPNSKQRYDLEILQSLRKIIRAVDIHSRKLSSQHDITTPQLTTLLAISEHGPLSLASIAKKVYLSSSTLVGIVDRLETKGYVSRQRSATDRRQTWISITSQGKDFAKQAPSPLQETLAKALTKLTALEQTTISLSLHRIVELMGAEEIEAGPILQTESTDVKEK